MIQICYYKIPTFGEICLKNSALPPKRKFLNKLERTLSSLWCVTSKYNVHDLFFHLTVLAYRNLSNITNSASPVLCRYPFYFYYLPLPVWQDTIYSFTLCIHLFPVFSFWTHCLCVLNFWVFTQCLEEILYFVNEIKFKTFLVKLFNCGKYP
jgi:hypothetical protein